MSMDTAAKRRSALNFGAPLTMALPIADASIDEDDRETICFEYEGLTFSVAVSSRRVRSTAAIVSRRKRVSKRRSR